MSKDKYVIKQIINRKPAPMPIGELKEDGMFLSIHENMISQIVEAKNNREFEFVCSQIQKFIEENNIGVCFAINKDELTDCLQEHQKLKLEIANLEAKLAESEEANKYLKGIKRYDIGEMLTENAKLKQQLDEKDAELKKYNEYFESFACNTFEDFEDFLGTFMLNPHEEQTLIRELKNELDEKDKEIENIKLCRCVNCKNEYEFMLEGLVEDLEKQIDKDDQNKISFAVDILEELTDCSNYINSKLDFECGSYVSEKAIRDKIKYLKGKKDE